MNRLLTLFFSFALHQAFCQDSTFTIYFPFDKAKLTTNAKKELDRMITQYQGRENYKLTIKGFCDNVGSHDYNDKLSEERIIQAESYLENNGISRSLIVYKKGYGKRLPFNNNVTAEEREQNRRVEISVQKMGLFTDTIGLTTLPPADNPGKKKDSLLSFSKENLDSAREGQSLVLKNINFYGGRHTFLPQSVPALNELLEIMKANPTLTIEIHGHICCLPGSSEDGTDADANDKHLSYNRAWAVLEFLVKGGIAMDRMTYQGFGGRFPLVYPEVTEEDRSANRRVEIKIVKK